MGRYTGPVERLSRREGVELELKGLRHARGKSALTRRGAVPPGQHGAGRRRQESVYALQLREKQRAKRYYGVRERQFRRYVARATRFRGRTGELLLQLLELRLDNVVTRLGLAGTRAQARQFVSHGHVTVDGARVDIASYQVRPGQTIAIRESSPVAELAREASELLSSAPTWLRADPDRLAGTILHPPERDEIRVPVTEQLIVEFSSRV